MFHVKGKKVIQYFHHQLPEKGGESNDRKTSAITYLSSLGPWRGLLPAKPIMFTWSFISMMSPTV